jgi:DNA-binding beta-propeller fold protein YncE
MELESAFEAPVATNRFVWTANPETNRVALINATTFEVRLAEVGLAPETVAGLPGDERDRAIVLNRGSEDATIMDVAENGTLATSTVATHAGANALAVSPSGAWAIAWTDAASIAEQALDPTDGFQDLTVIDLRGEPSSTVLSVGYRPSRISFDEDETRAFVVTEPGLSVVELGDAPRADRLVELTAERVTDQAARDVSVTPDGRLAVVRVDAQTSLGFVDIESGERTSLDLGAYVTDLDLSSDGAQAFAVAGAKLVVLPVPPGDVRPEDLQRAGVEGTVPRSVSVSPDTKLALLYSNADENPYLTVLTSDSGWADFEGHALDLHAPVQAAFASPSALHGIAFQATAEGSRKAGAFSLVSAQVDRAPKIIGTDAPPIAVAYTPDGANAVIATRDIAKRSFGMYLVHLDNLEENFYSLPSPPLSAGVVPEANRAFVAQAHPEGRITFVDLDSGSARTLTGFELATKVVDQ